VVLSSWGGNRGPSGKIAAYHRVYDCVTCGLTAFDWDRLHCCCYCYYCYWVHRVLIQGFCPQLCNSYCTNAVSTIVLLLNVVKSCILSLAVFSYNLSHV